MRMFGDVTKGLKRQRRALAKQVRQIEGVLAKLAKLEGKKARRKVKRVSARRKKAKSAYGPVVPKAGAKPVKVKIDTDLEAKRKRAAELKRSSRPSDSGE